MYILQQNSLNVQFSHVPKITSIVLTSAVEDSTESHTASLAFVLPWGIQIVRIDIAWTPVQRNPSSQDR